MFCDLASVRTQIGLPLIKFMILFLASFTIMINFAYGQPTIPDDPPWYVRSELCANKDTAAMTTAFDLLRKAIEQQGIDNRKLQEQVSDLIDHSSQVRLILAHLIDTIHTLVTRMAAKYPCQCDV